MNSEIGNKGLLKTLAEGLQILDPKQAPSVLDTDSVKVVAGLDIGSASIEPFQLVLLGPPLLGAVDSVTWEMVGDGFGTFGNQGEFYQRRADRHVIITNFQLGFDFDAAGLAAEIAAGATANMRMYKSRELTHPDPYSYFDIAVVEQTYFARAGKLQYDIAWPDWHSRSRDAAGNIHVSGGVKSIFLPLGQAFAVTLGRDPIANWPVNSRLRGFCSGYAIPAGCALPWM